MTVKDDLHHLVDELDDDAALEALVLLQDLQLPPRVLREAPPIDGEPETDEERQLVFQYDYDVRIMRVLRVLPRWWAYRD
jgi:hypothetical protein